VVGRFLGYKDIEVIPDQFRNLSDITIRGYFWKKAIEFDLSANFTVAEIDKFIKPIGLVASLDDCLKACVTEGKRVIRVDRSLADMRSRGWDNDKRLAPLIVALIRELDKRFPEPLPVIKQAVSDVLAKLRVSQSTINTLNSMVRYAAINVTSFPKAVPPEKLLRVKNRSYVALQNEDKKSTPGVVKRLTKHQLNSMANDVMQDKSGVCTSFAATAAHLMLSDVNRDVTTRIEYLAGTAHCICVLNREEHPKDTADSVVTINDWSKDAIIVDPWSGAMGNQVFYLRPYPHATMFNSKIDRVFDSLKDTL
jgi:hypothetical protein